MPGTTQGMKKKQAKTRMFVLANYINRRGINNTLILPMCRHLNQAEDSYLMIRDKLHDIAFNDSESKLPYSLDQTHLISLRIANSRRRCLFKYG